MYVQDDSTDSVFRVRPDPQQGLRFNSSKLLLDPYAKAIAGEVSWADEMFGYVIGGEKEDLTQDFRDDAWGVPKSVVIDTGFDWRMTLGGTSAPRSTRSSSGASTTPAGMATVTCED